MCKCISRCSQQYPYTPSKNNKVQIKAVDIMIGVISDDLT